MPRRRIHESDTARVAASRKRRRQTHLSVYLDPPAAEALDWLAEAEGGKKAAVQAAIMAAYREKARLPTTVAVSVVPAGSTLATDTARKARGERAE